MQKFLKNALTYSYLIVVLLLVSCGQESSNNASNNHSRTSQSPSIEYTASNYDIKQYSDADWLYENFFGEYGLPKQFKLVIHNDLKRLANGLNLVYKRDGEDKAIQNMIKVSRFVSQAKQSFMAYDMVNNLAISTFDEDALNLMLPTSSTLSTQTLTESSDKKTTTENIEAINQLTNDYIEYYKQQETLVKEYDLPYPYSGFTSQNHLS